MATEREYTRIYFISNQTIKSKQRKDAQDKFIEKYHIDIVILDGVWLLEEVFKNNFIDIAVDSLNLSSIYKNKKVIKGTNDVERERLLNELEEKIQNPNRYSIYDFQKVEDALEAAILARKLERPREEVEGKFDRAIRFSEKLNFNRHWIRIHYQKAWTYLYYFDDYPLFIEEYKNLKKYISVNSSSDEIELYVNLFNSLRGFCASNCNLENYKINIAHEKKELYSFLDKISKDENRPNTSIQAGIDLSIQALMDSAEENKNPDALFQKLYTYLTKITRVLEFPFEGYHQIFEELGNLYPNNKECDKLVDLIASIAETRSSELASGKIFLQRGGQKYVNDYVKDSIVFFGKAVLKLAKDESEYELNLALRSLGHAFSNLGLYWASNNCFVSANFIAFKPWHQQGKIDKRTFECTKQLAINELILGRIPSFLTWYELLQVLNNIIEFDDSDEEIPIFEMLDAFLSVRLANSTKEENNLSLLPDILEKHSLWLSQNTVLFKLGYGDLIINDYKNININSESELFDHFEIIANQPFRRQMIYETDFLADNVIVIKSKILGCTFKYKMQSEIELLLAAETFAAFFENYFSTSFKELLPHSEEILIRLIKNEKVRLFDFSENDSGSEYTVDINKFSFPKESFPQLWEKMVNFTVHIISNNFFSKDILGHLDNLFKYEELHERLAFVYEYRNFIISVLGDNPKLFWRDWSRDKKEYCLRGNELINFKIVESKETNSKINDNSFTESRHDENKVISIIQDKLWNQAIWKGFGPFYANFGFGIFLAFENGNAGKAIFDDWISRFGKEDKDEIIKITIIKGVNKNNPYWYKVHISANYQSKLFNSKERYFSVTARFHQMTPDNPENLYRIEKIIGNKKPFLFFPAMITKDGKDLVPFIDKAIVKNNIDIKNAWELSINDPDSVVILNDDDPIIPIEIKNAPVLEILQNRK